MAQQPHKNAHKEVERDHWGKNQWDLRREFLQEKGISRFAAFGTSGEGHYLPTGLEEISCAILTPDEKVRFCILGWDENKIAPDGTTGYYTLTLRECSLKEIGTGEYNSEYIRARKQLGLPLTEEQERILREWEEEQKKYYPNN